MVHEPPFCSSSIFKSLVLNRASSSRGMVQGSGTTVSFTTILTPGSRLQNGDQRLENLDTIFVRPIVENVAEVVHSCTSRLGS